MNPWLISAAVLIAGLLPCLAVAVRAPLADALVAMQAAGGLATTILVLLAEGTHRQPFIDLALVSALLTTVGSLVFARMMERL